MTEARLLANSSHQSFAVIRREQLSFPNCACKLFVTVPPHLSNNQIAAGLLKVFFENSLEKFIADPGGNVVFGYYPNSDQGQGYTAGAIHLDLYKGARTLTIDIGQASAPLEYQFSY
jgi:hypothetical protein